jgi:hypothetical protein
MFNVVVIDEMDRHEKQLFIYLPLWPYLAPSGD